MTTKYLVYASAALMALLGFLLAFAPLLHWQFHHLEIAMPRLTPTPAIGLLCIALSMYVARFQRVACLLATALSASISVVFIYTVAKHGEGGSLVAVVATITTGLTFVTALRLDGTVNRNSTRRAFATLAVVLVVGLTYGIIGFMVLDRRAFHQPDIDAWQAFLMTSRAILLPDNAISTPTHLARLFVASLNGVGIAMAIALLSALFQPLRLDTVAEARSRQRLRVLLERTSRSTEDYFKLWPTDKSYYFSLSGQACVTYTVSHRSVIILGDPSGETKEFPALLEHFFQLIQERGWRIIVINASQDGSILYANYGLTRLAIGSDATVATDHFIESTVRNKHFRYITNKAHASALSVEEWLTLDTSRIRTLRAISDSWLARDGRREYTFFMGYFDPAYLRDSRVFVLCSKGIPVAYISLVPSFNVFYASIDHFRSLDTMPSIGMHYLLSEVIRQLGREKISRLNLGFAPLSRLSDLGLDRPTKQLFEIVRRFGTRYYSFKGVEQFKNKFEPEWQPSVLLFSGTIASLGTVMRDIDSATRYNEPARRWFSIGSSIVGVIALVVIIYIGTQ